MKQIIIRPLTVFSVFALLALVNPALAQQLDAPRLSVGTDQQLVSLSWSEVSGATGYQILYAPYPYLGPDTVQTIDVGLTLSLSDMLPQGSAYYLAVEAYNAAATSELSNIEYFIVDEDHLSFASDPGSFYGLTLISPNASDSSFLIDDFGEIKHQWDTSRSPRLSAYLLPNGHLLRTGALNTGYFDSGGKGGVIEEFDWEGNLVWDFEYSDENKTLHHDMELLPNGNILALSWEQRDGIWAEVIIEIEKTGNSGGNVVWSWDIFDHEQEMGLDSSNANNEDWVHLNALDYNVATDQIMISSRAHSTIWILNKADGSVAARSSVDLSGQHDAKWIDDRRADSNITVFNNGTGFSRAQELSPELDSVIFSYGNADTEFFFSQRISGVQRLGNGNTLICVGMEGVILELDINGNRIREYVNTYGESTPNGFSSAIFRAEKYPTGYTPYF